MADTTEVITYFSGERKLAMRVIFLSDGASTAQANILDISTLAGTPTKVSILKIEGAVNKIDYMYLKFDHTADDEALVLPAGEVDLDFTQGFGVTDPASAGGTGDLLLNAVGPAANGSAVLNFLLYLHE